MKKKLLILGAGIYQVPLIRKAKELGLYTIVCSIPGNYPGFREADQRYGVDTTDKDAILEIAQREKIAGICTAGTDVAIPSVGFVCEKMGLSGVRYESALNATDKLRMKRAFRAKHVSTAEFREINSLEELRETYRLFLKPAILKVTDKSGSRGIVKIEDEADLESAYSYCREASNQSVFLLEEFIDANEIGVDGFVQNGKLELYLPHKKNVISNGKTDIPLGHEFPLALTEQQDKNLREEIQKAICALGLENCAFNADVFTDGNKIYIIEMGARSGATGIPELISIYCGFDYYEKMLRAALGEHVDFSYGEKITPCISQLLFSRKEGILEDITIPEMSGVNVTIDVQPGEYVDKIRNGTSRIGQIVVSGETLEQAREKLNMFLERCEIVLRQ